MDKELGIFGQAGVILFIVSIAVMIYGFMTIFTGGAFAQEILLGGIISALGGVTLTHIDG